jgi:hypothetical protein
MLLKLATMELSGGFPHALDPTYARRTLALGDEGYAAVLECAKSPHEFLSRNAVAVLAQYPLPEASAELRKIWRSTGDPVTRVRAAMGLIRRREAAILPDLVEDAKSGGTTARTIALHGLGVLGDPAGAQPVIDLIVAGPGALASTAVPALGRMKAGKNELLAYEARVRKMFEGDDAVKLAGTDWTPSAEEPSAGVKIVRQMCVLALAMIGEKTFVDETLRRVDRSGIDGFHRATHYLVVEALAGSEDGAKLLRTRVIEADVDDALRVEALRALAAAKRIDAAYLDARALDVKLGEAARAAALQLLADRDEKLAAAACAKILDDYAAGRTTLPGLVTAAAEMGGRRGLLELGVVRNALDRAVATRAFARREANEDVDIARAEVRIHPPLLETLAIELGRLGVAEAISPLRSILADTKLPQGRAEAVLALGAIDGEEPARLIAGALEDRDGWVRFCAYRAAAKRVGQDYFCDWIFGGDEARDACARMYRAALK